MQGAAIDILEVRMVFLAIPCEVYLLNAMFVFGLGQRRGGSRERELICCPRFVAHSRNRWQNLARANPTTVSFKNPLRHET
jgi:hypothetical protein